MTKRQTQADHKIEKIESQLAATADVRQKVDLINELAWELSHTDSHRTITLSNEARLLASTGQFAGRPYRKGLALSLRNLGQGHLQLSNYDQALSYLLGSLSLAEELADKIGQVTVLNTLGQAYRHLSDYPAGLDCHLKALRICEQLEEAREEEARSLQGIGLIYRLLEAYPKALDYFLKSLQLYREIKHKQGEADALHNIGIAYRHLGDYGKALTNGLASLELYRQLGARQGEAEVLGSLGELCRVKGDYKEALDYLKQCLNLSGQINNKLHSSWAVLNMGIVYQQQQNLDEALTHLHRALAMAEEIKAKRRQFECHQALAELCKKMGNSEKALAHYEQFHTIKEDVFSQEADHKLKNLEMVRRVETAQKESEIYQLKNIELEQEIAERKQLEANLRASEEKYRQVVERSNDGIAVVQAGRMEFSNSQMETILGYTAAQLRATPFENFVIPQDRAKIKAFHQRRLQGESVPSRYETRLARKNGEPVDVEISATLVEYESQPAVLTFIRDITEEKQIEAALRRLNEELEQRVETRTQELLAEIKERQAAEQFLRESEDRFRRVITSISDHIYMTEITPDGRRINLYLSPNVEELTGYPLKKFMLDWNFWPSKVIHPDDRPRATAHALHLTMERGDEIEYRLIRADGQIIWVRDSARVEDAGESKIVYGVVSDITERKQAEVEKESQAETLRQYAQRLELLHIVSSSFNQARTRQQVAQALLVTTMGITEAQYGAILLIDEESLIPVFSMGAEYEAAEPQPELIDDLIWQVIQEKHPRFVSDLAEQNPSANFHQIASVAIIPLKAMETVVGILQLSYQRCRQFVEEETRLLTVVCEIAGNALQRNIMMETLEQRVADRTRELAALYDVTVLASGSQALAEVLEQSLEKVLEAGRCDATCIYLVDEDEKNLRLIAQAGLPADGDLLTAVLPIQPPLATWIATWDQKLMMTPDLATDQNIPPEMRLEDFRSYLGVPMRVKERALGLLNLFWRSTRNLALEEVVLLSTMADQMGVAVEIARLRQRVATTAVIEERQRLVRELHDSVTQSMYSQTLFARTAKDALEDGYLNKLADTLAKLDENALHTLKEMRLLLYELRPSILEQEGLVQALNTRLGTVEQRVGVKAQFEVDGSIELSNYVEVELYRIAIEALNNTLKHAAATEVRVNLWTEDDRITLEITDNGRGFDPEALGQGGLGLKSMRERSEQLGGRLTISSAPGAGTKVILRNV